MNEMKNVWKINRLTSRFYGFILLVNVIAVAVSLRFVFMEYLNSFITLGIGLVFLPVTYNLFKNERSRVEKLFQKVHLMEDALVFEELPHHRKSNVSTNVAYENVLNISFNGNKIRIQLVKRTDWQGEQCEYFVPFGNVPKRQTFIWNGKSEKEKQEIQKFLATKIKSLS